MEINKGNNNNNGISSSSVGKRWMNEWGWRGGGGVLGF